MIPKPLKPLLLLTSLIALAGPVLSAQEPKPVVSEAKPSSAPSKSVSAQVKPVSAPSKSDPTQAKPASKSASQGSKPVAKDAKEPVKKDKPSAKKPGPATPNYNLNESPAVNATAKPPKPSTEKKPKPAKIPYDKRLNLNAASKEELMKLPGITEEYAAKIIAGRPYTSATGLVLNNVIPTTVYFLIRGQVAAGKVPSKP